MGSIPLTWRASAQVARLPIRAVARGPSAMLTISTPARSSSEIRERSDAASVPGGLVSSTETANSPAAIRWPSRLRSPRGARALLFSFAGAGAAPLALGDAVTRGLLGPAPLILTAPSIARVCAGVVPQQPPIIRTPPLSIRPGVDAEVLGVGHIDGSAVGDRGQTGVGLDDDGATVADHLGGDLVELGGADAAVGADDLGAGGDEAGGDDLRSEAVAGDAVAGEDLLGDNRNRRGDAPRLTDGELELDDGREGLEEKDIDAGVDEDLNLFGESPERAQPVGLGGDRKAAAGRSDGAGDVGAIASGGAGELDAGAVDLDHPIAVAVAGERQTIGAKSVGLENLGAGVDVLAVNALYELGLREIELVVALG